MTDLNEQTSTDSDDGRLRRTGTWLATSKTTGVLAWAFCAVLAVVVAAAVVIAVTRDNDSGNTAGPQTSVPSTTAPAPAAPGTQFGVPSSDIFGRVVAQPVNPRGEALPQAPADRSQFRQGDPVAAPDGMMWQQVGPFVLPFSTSAGPARIDGPIARGYTQTPQGAALAAWQASWRINIDPESLDAVFDNQIEPSTRGNKALWAPKQWLDWSQYPQQYRPDAFRVTGWSDDNSYAVIEYALRDMRTGTQTGWFTARFEVVWQDGDWKLRRPSTQLPPQNLTSLAGWTQW
ncbi:hypothetical protein MWT96_24875 (plasmid) [Prescottella equi]|uniref:DUF8175 domain-containing protein n=1 Tax=Rhodococcus hoagii TaxID=43767 RepID=A0A9Q2UQM9_RHOHA|nr:hypothetical protein [Prescottella equi]AVR64889.1 hypothetical protein pRERM100c [Prescottella equi]MBM4479804.1 hypothetical protein [Prescottella equi]MBM4487682.1 hypothetical protein [Prescottella equi]MBM4487752.1 hypothetical protein [Prescottella equi]MBM4498372.1 hypothetical protein [Prescottella equi]